MKKYKLIDETKIFGTIVFHRIKALKDFGNVCKGDLGGWIKKEANLSQEGSCWVYDDAEVYGNARVCGDAEVFGDAKVFGDAEILGKARVYGDARVCGDAKVLGNARVYDNAWVFGNARVCGNAMVFGKAFVSDNAEVFGNAEVSGLAWVYNNAKVYDDAWVFDEALISKCGNKWTFTTGKNVSVGNSADSSNILWQDTPVASNSIKSIPPMISKDCLLGLIAITVFDVVATVGILIYLFMQRG